MGGGGGGRGRKAGGQTDWLARERVPLVKHLPKHEELSLVPQIHPKNYMSQHTFVIPVLGSRRQAGRQIPGDRWPASLG